MTEQAEISAKIFEEHGAKFTGIGKTKALGRMKDGNVIMRFLDSYTGTAGVKDGGGNEIAGVQKGLGRMNLEMTVKLYHMLEKELGIPTQNRWHDAEQGILVASHAQLLGKDMPFELMPVDEKFGSQITSGRKIECRSRGVEIIGRNVGTGSFQNQWPHMQDGIDLRDERGYPLIDLTVKWDGEGHDWYPGDPKFPRSYFVRQGVNKNDLDTAINYTQHATKFLTKQFEKQGIKLLDTKMEFGKTQSDRLILVDEISTGTSRLRRDGKKMSEAEIHAAVMEM